MTFSKKKKKNLRFYNDEDRIQKQNNSLQSKIESKKTNSYIFITVTSRWMNEIKK